MTLIDRGTFCRTRIKLEEDTPEMGIAPDLWPVVMKDGKLIVGNSKQEIKQLSILQSSPTQTLDFRRVVERANRTIRRTAVVLGFLTWFAITATIWLSLFALDNLLDLPTGFAISLCDYGTDCHAGGLLQVCGGSP